MNNTFIFILLLIFTCFAEARTCTTTDSEITNEVLFVINTDVPKHLKGATITVTLVDGRVSKVPAEKFKVVPRMQQTIVTHTVQKSKDECVDVVAGEERKNRVSILAGEAPKGSLDRSLSGNKVSVSSTRGAALGLQYQRKISERFSLGGQIQSNDSGSAMLGYEF